VFAGTHGIANGLDAVLNAAVELKRRGRDDIKLLLIGAGKCKQDLRVRAQREVLGNVFFLDPVNKDRLAGLMAATDVGMQILANVPAFYFGTSPNKFFDYIAAGVPVLNNYPGWLAQMIVEHRCGFAVPPDNAVAFADALVQAASDRSALKAMGERAHALAETEFNRRRLANRWVDTLENVWREKSEQNAEPRVS
jgi:glycosyltransferase involved in cell wall biosynthesis